MGTKNTAPVDHLCYAKGLAKEYFSIFKWIADMGS